MSNDKMQIMEPGELDLRKVFEETTNKNIRTVIQYTTETRAMMREMETQMKDLQKKIIEQNTQITSLQTQISMVRAAAYRPGD